MLTVVCFRVFKERVARYRNVRTNCRLLSISILARDKPTVFPLHPFPFSARDKICVCMSDPERVLSKDLSHRFPSVRCSANDLLIIRSKAAEAGVSVSAYIRTMCVDGTVTARMPMADLDLIIQLRRIGNNLNQLTKHTHARGGENPAQLVSVLSELERILQRVQ